MNSKEIILFENLAGQDCINSKRLRPNCVFFISSQRTLSLSLSLSLIPPASHLPISFFILPYLSLSPPPLCDCLSLYHECRACMLHNGRVLKSCTHLKGITDNRIRIPHRFGANAFANIVGIHVPYVHIYDV